MAVVATTEGVKLFHGGAHAGHRGAHAGPGRESKSKAKVDGVSVDKDGAEMYRAVPEPLRKAAAASGLREVVVVDKEGMAAVAGRPSPGYDAITGTYKDDGKLYVLKQADKAKMASTLTHEMGHALDSVGADGKFTLSESKEWMAASGWKADKRGNYKLKETMLDRPVSNYGRSSPWEDFAETYRVMTSGTRFERRVMQGESQKRYSYMQKLLAGKGYVVD